MALLVIRIARLSRVRHGIRYKLHTDGGHRVLVWPGTSANEPLSLLQYAPGIHQ